MMHMGDLLRQLYRTRYKKNPSASIAPVVESFREYCVGATGGATGRLSHYLYIMQFDLPGMVDHVHALGFGLGQGRGICFGFVLCASWNDRSIRSALHPPAHGMFCQDIAESQNRQLKDSFVSFTNRGGGAEGHAGALRQALQRVFLSYHVPLVVRGVPKRTECQNRDAYRGSDSEPEATGVGESLIFFKKRGSLDHIDRTI